MNGIQYERYCAKYLSRKGYKKIQFTKASGDQGIDIIAEKGKLKYGFQCKYYSGTVGNDAVQQAFSGIAYYGLDKAVVITNSTFSTGAISLAEQTDVILWEEIDPYQEYNRFTIYQIISLLLFSWSLIQLYRIFTTAAANKDNSFLSYCFMMIACFLQAIPHRSRTVTFEALALMGMHIILYNTMNPFSLNFYSSVILSFMIITAIKLIHYQKKYMLQKMAEKRSQIKQNIYDIRQMICDHITRILTHEFNCEIRHAEITKKDDELVITFQTNRTKTNEIENVARKLNNCSEYENYSFKPQSARVITLTIRKNKQLL